MFKVLSLSFEGLEAREGLTLAEYLLSSATAGRMKQEAVLRDCQPFTEQPERKEEKKIASEPFLLLDSIDFHRLYLILSHFASSFLLPRDLSAPKLLVMGIPQERNDFD